MFRKVADLFRTVRDTVFPKGPDLNVPVRYTDLPDPVLRKPKQARGKRGPAVTPALDAALALLEQEAIQRRAKRAEVFKRPLPTLEQIFDRLHKAGVSITINGASNET